MEEHISTIISILTLLALLIGFWDKIFSKGKKEKGVEDKVAELEKSDASIKKNIADINSDIKTIKENHLSHIQGDINSINIKLERVETTLEFIKNK